MEFVKSFIALLFLTAILSTSFGDECANVDVCSCQASAYKINLSPLNNGSNPRFSTAGGDYTFYYQPCVALSGRFSTPGGDYTFYYQPCIALSGKCVAQGSNPEAVCQVSKSGGGEYDVGDANSASFSGDADAGSLKLTYIADPRTSVISLQCSCAEGDFSFVNESPVNTYNFALKTIYACGSETPNCGPDNTQHGSSTVSVFLNLIRTLWFGIASLLH